ncbi:MAG: hypothetical protein E7176_06525 [Erysipelotrichaceae bacterium]|nr:hypothetical protein [Erysipelotrichaceae bacterium]
MGLFGKNKFEHAVEFQRDNAMKLKSIKRKLMGEFEEDYKDDANYKLILMATDSLISYVENEDVTSNKDKKKEVKLAEQKINELVDELGDIVKSRNLSMEKLYSFVTESIKDLYSFYAGAWDECYIIENKDYSERFNNLLAAYKQQNQILARKAEKEKKKEILKDSCRTGNVDVNYVKKIKEEILDINADIAELDLSIKSSQNVIDNLVVQCETIANVERSKEQTKHLEHKKSISHVIAEGEKVDKELYEKVVNDFDELTKYNQKHKESVENAYAKNPRRNRGIDATNEDIISTEAKQFEEPKSLEEELAELENL